MPQLEKFIKAVKLVKPEGMLDMGLVVNQNGQAIDWHDNIFKKNEILEVIPGKHPDDLIRQIFQALQDKKWTRQA